MSQKFRLNINGRVEDLAVDDPDVPLLYVLRDDLGLHGPRFGCGLGQMVFAPNSSDLAAALQFTLQAGLQRFLSSAVDVQLVVVTAVDAQLLVEVTYTLRQTGDVSVAQVELSVEPA